MKTRHAAIVLLSTLMLGACDVSTPSQLSVRQVQLKEEVKTTTFDARSLDSDAINGIASDYSRNGRGKVSLTLSYDASGAGAQMRAKKQATHWLNAFRQNGVNDMEVDYVAMTDSAYAGQAIVSYTALVASPPKDCGRIPGYQGAETLAGAEGYGIGCETAAMLSKMVADPSDLMGKAGTPDDDSRRQGAVVENYKLGKQNQKLQGMNASAIGSSGGGGGG